MVALFGCVWAIVTTAACVVAVVTRRSVLAWMKARRWRKSGDDTVEIVRPGLRKVAVYAALVVLALPAAVYAGSTALPGPGGPMVGGTIPNALTLTGDNSGGTGTVRIRPSDEDTQLVLCEASNNASPEVCSSLQHANISSTIVNTGLISNGYMDSAGALQRNNTSFGQTWHYATTGTTAANNIVGMRVYGTGGAAAGDVNLAATAAATSTLTVGALGTVTNDFRGPITNGGSATCGGSTAGAVCVADTDLVQYSSGDTVQRIFSTSASGLAYTQLINNSLGAAASFGFGNGSYADADYANVAWWVSNTASHPLRAGNTANVGVTTGFFKVTDDLSAGNGEGTNHMIVYGGGTIAFPSTQTITCADNGGGTNATQNLDPQAHTITILNNDATGCDVTMQETSAQLGAVAVICVDPASTATNVNLADVANVFNGAAPAMSQGDCITIRYFDAANDLWLQTGASNN